MPSLRSSIRNELLSAALTIWRWGRQNVAGADDADADIKRGITLGSFEQRGEWVRDPLLALDCPDPVTRIREIKERDPERQRVSELFAAWWEAHHDIPYGSATSRRKCGTSQTQGAKAANT